jgi:Glycosyl transferases group 1
VVIPLLPLSGLRIAVTIPPSTWFGGVDYAFAMDMADEMRRLGANLLAIDVAGFVDHRPGHSREAIEALRLFQPDVAMSLPNAGYALLCTTPEGGNVFRDVLEIPTIMIWDHGVHQFSRLLLGSAGRSNQCCVARLRAELENSLFIHYSPDKGHIAAMDTLGILNANKVHSFVHFAFPIYARRASGPLTGGLAGPRLAFAGNIYLEGSCRLPFRNDPVLAAIEARMLAGKEADLTRSIWNLLMDEIDRCDEATRDELGLHPNCASFWPFVNDEVQIVGTTESRLTVLKGLRREIDFFGNFMEPQMAGTVLEEFGIRMRGSLDCLTELPSLYRNRELIVDVINAGYISGISPKVPSCLACGGLILFDYKQDFREAIGELADLVMYRSLDHLNSLVEEYLENPRKRREVTLDLQQRVLREFTFGAFCQLALADEPKWHT